jgi:hypothetical protein
MAVSTGTVGFGLFVLPKRYPYRIKLRVLLRQHDLKAMVARLR